MPIWYKRSPIEYKPPDPRLDVPASGRIAEAAHRSFHPQRVGAYNEAQVGRYLRFLQKFFSMKGREPAEVTVAGEVLPTLALFHGSENRYLEAWSKFAQDASLGASAGNFSAVQLRNPAGSNVVLVVEQVFFSTSVGATEIISTGVAAADLGGVGTALKEFDFRGNRNSTAFLSSANQAGNNDLGDARWQIQTLAAQPQTLVQYEDMCIPILPGRGMNCRPNGANVGNTVTYQWRERFLEESERA